MGRFKAGAVHGDGSFLFQEGGRLTGKWKNGKILNKSVAFDGIPPPHLFSSFA